MVIRRMIVGVMVLGASVLLAGVAGAHYNQGHAEACSKEGPRSSNPHCQPGHPSAPSDSNKHGNGNKGGNDDKPEPFVLPEEVPNRGHRDRDGDGSGDACGPRAVDEANDAADRTAGTARTVVEYAEWEIERHTPQQVRDARDTALNTARDAVAEIRDAAGL